jgi:hypothetical protein
MRYNKSGIVACDEEFKTFKKQRYFKLKPHHAKSHLINLEGFYLYQMVAYLFRRKQPNSNNLHLMKNTHIMRAYVFLILIFISISCSKNENSDRNIGMVGISEVIIPDTVTSLENIQVYAKAEATNGCWNNLYLDLSKVNEFEYYIKAFGTFESSGACPEVMVYKDSVIDIQPMQKGIYIFKISQSPNLIVIDTLVIE